MKFFQATENALFLANSFFVIDSAMPVFTLKSQRFKYLSAICAPDASCKSHVFHLAELLIGFGLPHQGV